MGLFWGSLIGTGVAVAFIILLIGVSEVMEFPNTQAGGMSKAWTYIGLSLMWILSVFGIGTVIGLFL